MSEWISVKEFAEDSRWHEKIKAAGSWPETQRLMRERYEWWSALMEWDDKKKAWVRTKCPDCKRPWSEHTAHTSDPLLQNCPASADERGESRRQMSGRECSLCKPATEQGKEPR